LARGKTLSFGDFTLSQTALGYRQEEIPWSDVGRVKVENGFVQVHKAGAKNRWVLVEVARIPNVRVFLASVEDMKTAVASVPRALGNQVAVNVEWDEADPFNRRSKNPRARLFVGVTVLLGAVGLVLYHARWVQSVLQGPVPVTPATLQELKDPETLPNL
jgi:hypothetical protein